MPLSYLAVFIVAFLASLLGPLCGIGGGVIIKPVVDAMNVMPVATVSFLSSISVLTMSLATLTQNAVAKTSTVNVRSMLPLALGSAVGGVVGKLVFNSLGTILPDAELVGAAQAAVLIVLTAVVFVYTIRRSSIQGLNVQAGAAKAATHVGNAMRLFHQHDPAIFGVALETDLYCETIADGRHLHPGTVRLYAKAKGWDRVLAITDSIMAAGLPDGHYKLGVNDVVVEDGDAKLASNGVRAGSTLTQAQALRNLMKFTGAPVEEASKANSANPAALFGWADRGHIDEGALADLVLLDEDYEVARTIVGGRTVYTR